MTFKMENFSFRWKLGILLFECCDFKTFFGDSFILDNKNEILWTIRMVVEDVIEACINDIRSIEFQATVIVFIYSYYSRELEY